MKWQPIETAPKDGSKIDLWIDYGQGQGERVPDSYWQSGQEPLCFDSSRKEGWAAANKGYDGCDGWADDPEDGSVATHWMPPPPAPSL